MNHQFVVPCLMGVEGLVADELRFAQFSQVEAQNGRVLFGGDISEGARANVLLRCGERVLLHLGGFYAHTFTQLFDGVNAIAWGDVLGKDDAFPVRGHSINSQLHSVPDCQSIIKKAIVKRLQEQYATEWFSETGPKKQVQFSLRDDRVDIYLDTTGAPLFKRGYKLEQNEATLRETLAASMVKIARYRGRDTVIDPMCGSGTLVIEAAMAARRMAPGARRIFDAQLWDDAWGKAFAEQKEAAIAQEKNDPIRIFASDIDPAAVELTRQNARRAGVEDDITFAVADACTREYTDGILLCNPPYGVRMLDVERARALYRDWGAQVRGVAGLKQYILSSDETFAQHFGRPADKKRKLYNGMIKCDLYMYLKG